MTKSTVALARSITWAGSKQTYYTAIWMVDRSLVEEFLCAYAYFRWVDDVIDGSSTSNLERKTFITRQREVIDNLSHYEIIDDLTEQERLVVELIRKHSHPDARLWSFINNMFAIIEFDAYRKGRLISEEELSWYSESLSRSVTDGLQYFIGNDHEYPMTDSRNCAAYGAHIAHLLRDMVRDIRDGFINIPQEYLLDRGITPNTIETTAFRDWVEERVKLAWEYIRRGKMYLDQLQVLRCKIVGYWYCAKFEGVLNAIEKDRFVLRRTYSNKRRSSLWLSMGWLALSTTFKHNIR